MKRWFIRTFGLKGSWSWACRQMAKGKVVYPSDATGTVKYCISYEDHGPIMWTFNRNPDLKLKGSNRGGWESANIFLSDFMNTDWELY